MVPHNNARNGSCTNNGRLLFVYNGSVNNAPGAVALIIIIMCSVVIMSGQ